ncbi:nuclear poly(a) polymerase [Striga asiatica]|uniref:Nuclear poly(A) polymerase n=1 Tax=Striga asiatica TaxID=4170 RepID=A0A5A7RE13_STRAF|nr:nuclear poly(a) polymerase [Striga asiatica]
MRRGTMKKETTFMRVDSLARDIFKSFESVRKEVKIAVRCLGEDEDIIRVLSFGGFRLGMGDAGKNIPKGGPVPGFKIMLKPGKLMKKFVKAERRGWDGPRVFDYLEEKVVPSPHILETEGGFRFGRKRAKFAKQSIMV